MRLLQGMGKPLIQGRTYIETLLLTMTALEMVNPSLDTREFIAKRLEEELCSIASGMKFLVSMYKNLVYEKIEEELGDIAKPDLQGCFIYDQLYNWARANRRYIIGKKSDIIRVEDADAMIKTVITRIVRSSVMGVFYSSGFISVKANE